MDKRLQDLNLKEVAKKTQLELEFLNALVEKDFKSLSKFNVKGFCKILTREYEIDFTSFLEEHYAFLDESSGQKSIKKDDASPQITTQVDSYSQKSSAFWIYLLVILILLVGGVFAAYKYGFFDKFLATNDDPINSSVIDIVGEAKDNLNSTLITNDSSNSQEDTNEDTQNENTQKAEESTQEDTKTDENNKSIEQNVSTPAPVQSATVMQDAISRINNKQEAVFSTSGKVWVGFITLSDYKKTAIVTDQNFSVDLSVNQLILVGATALTVVDNEGNIQEFPAGSSKRFLVKDGKIRSVSLNEFMSNNKGREW